MPQKTALITCVTGQDGAYLSEFLLNKGYNDMMASDLKLTTKDQYLKQSGYRVMNYFE
jgi:GDP-D-mannose dehydratase